MTWMERDVGGVRYESCGFGFHFWLIWQHLPLVSGRLSHFKGHVRHTSPFSKHCGSILVKRFHSSFCSMHMKWAVDSCVVPGKAMETGQILNPSSYEVSFYVRLQYNMQPNLFPLITGWNVTSWTGYVRFFLLYQMGVVVFWVCIF